MSVYWQPNVFFWQGALIHLKTYCLVGDLLTAMFHYGWQVVRALSQKFVVSDCKF